MKKSLTLLLLIIFFTSNSVLSQTTVFAFGSSWKYLDNGSDQGIAWRNTGFNDAGWASGPAQLGYGDGDEATVVSYGPDINNKYITTYFRNSISIPNPSSFSGFTLNVKRDDGIVVYVNGTEVFRENMPTGSILFNTVAAGVASDDGTAILTATISPSFFVVGTNVISAEIHQSGGTSSDISFDMSLSGTAVPVSSSMVNYGSVWKYLDNGSNQGTNWRTTGFNDASWKSGPAQLGYGDGDEATVVSYGTNATKKYVTTYFRKTISVTGASSFANFTLNIKRDDGAVVYVNGTERFRTNMPTGTISNKTKAPTDAADDGNTPQTATLPAGSLVEGTNVVAVEIHQFSQSSSDISFDLELKGNSGAPSANLTRGPYMNSAVQTGITIRWRTDVATNSKVSFGASPASLTQSSTNSTVTTEHIVTLTGLTDNTLYYYNIGSTTQILQGDASNYFKTMPNAGSTQKIRILAMGDMGNNSTNQVNVRNAYQNFNGSNYTDAWILLGDNAYNSGTEQEYQTNFFNIYQGNLTKNHVLWPAPGNHDYANSSARQADHLIPYYDMFTLPSSGQAGGVPSNTEAFYSYNYGNVHFVALDSYGWETGNTRLYDTSGPQIVWLKQDLAANTMPWTIVYFHHPPYTKGSHNSDTETELINMRERVVRILERYHVDMVLNGHSHSYERSYLINGHYGVATSFNPATHALSTSSAKYDGSANSCTYIKNAADVRNGIVYAVVGSAGQLGGTSAGYTHNAMYYSNVTNGGALFFEVENNRLDAKWVCSDGTIRDKFTIMKNVNKTTNLNIVSGTPTVITASWIGNYGWNTGPTTKSITVSPVTATTYTVTDGVNCLTDVFNISVSAGARNNQNSITFSEPATHPEIKIMPALASRGQQVVVMANAARNAHISLIDINGRVIRSYLFSQTLYISTEDLQPGIYYLRLDGNFKSPPQKFVVM